MIHIPNSGGSIARIIGIDPGTANLGLSCVSVDIRSLDIIQSDAITLRGDKNPLDDWYCEMYGGRYGRMSGIRKMLMRAFTQLEPNCVVMESGFFHNLHPSAFLPLTEIRVLIQETLHEYDPWLELHFIDPSSIKNAVGAHGAAKKNPVKDSVAKITELNLQHPIDRYDEHSIDALAVAYTQVKRFRMSRI